MKEGRREGGTYLGDGRHGGVEDQGEVLHVAVFAVDLRREGGREGGMDGGEVRRDVRWF